MPTKRRSRRRKKYLRGNVEASLALSTLGSNAAIVGTVASSVIERTLVSSLVANWSLKDLTKVVSDGPVLVGVAHSDYSAAEIEEWIENTGGWNEGDLIAQEIAKRKIRIVGVFAAIGAGDTDTAVLQDGKMVKTILNWILTTGQTLDIWAYNAGASGLTGTAQLHTFGHANLWPR